MEEVNMEQVKTIDDNYNNLKAVIMALTQDYEKFKTKKVKVAGARVRNNLLNCKKICDIMRKQVLEQIKELPIKHRTKDEKLPVEVEVEPETLVVEELPPPTVKVDEELPTIVKIKRKRRANIVKTEEIKTE
jgi:hypothetical protein|tara:strand:- start:82 stop:477 length:396 start_codon:yes stop_codon:yes gene_type:complete